MEEESTSISGTVEDSSSGSTTARRAPLPPPPPRKRAKHGGCRVPSSLTTRFKGVVLQQNGHWGAQIYANHQRIWLGTFKTEAEAAAAYDSAALRLRPADSHRNFPPPPRSTPNYDEPAFQRLLPTDALLTMIKDGSYPAKLQDFLRSGPAAAAAAATGPPAAAVARRLFKKELTPSDVGKLNRLVIPKKHAVKHFPRTGPDEESELAFRDPAMRLWRFRYCYWRSSQSYVFTRGWSRFVREKKLRENDAVVFYSCRGPHAATEVGFLLIDVVRAEDAANANSDYIKGPSVLNRCTDNSNNREFSGEVVEAQGLLPKKPINSFMLFGVQICASE